MNELVYLNGQFTDALNAFISPNDRGFLLSDGVYEVVKYYNGKSFYLKDHLLRLQRSLDEVQIKADNVAELEAIIYQLVEQNSLSDKHAGIYLQITRGVNKRVHHFPDGIIPTIYAYAFEMPSNSHNLEFGIKVITNEDLRWQRCDIKSVSLLANTMIYNKAVEAGAGECILIRNGLVTEATHSSVLAVKGGKVITHPLTNQILPGITRKVILEICEENNVPVEERAIAENELFELDELIIAGTGSEITPVIVVDERPVGNKKPGELTRFLQHKFFERT